MRYKKEFFELQIRFAQVVAVLIDIPLEKALLDYTNLYVRFAIGRAFEKDHPVWRRFADGLNESADPTDWTYRYYLSRIDIIERQPMVATVGCFSYALHDAGRVRIHFENIEPTTMSPLSVDRLPVRHAELRELFDHVRRYQRHATHVAGTSWLYNLSAYQRCFPIGYTASATVANSRFRNMPLWGQFLDRHGGLRASVADKFIRRFPDVAGLQDLMSIFPLQALAVQAPIEEFYRFYGA